MRRQRNWFAILAIAGVVIARQYGKRNVPPSPAPDDALRARVDQLEAQIATLHERLSVAIGALEAQVLLIEAARSTPDLTAVEARLERSETHISGLLSAVEALFQQVVAITGKEEDALS